MKSSKNRKIIVVIAVLTMLCLIAGAWLLLFDSETGVNGRKAGERMQRTRDAVIAGIEITESDGINDVLDVIEQWMTADHVYPHGHTDRTDEHTFAAYDAAIEAGAHYVEPDVVVSGDGTLYVSHDPDAGRITGDGRYYASMSDDEIDKLRGRSGDKILKLSEVLDKYGTSVKYLRELKSADEVTINAFKSEIDARNLSGYVILQSEFPEVLDSLEETYPAMPKLLVVKNDYALNLAMTADYIDIVGARVQYMTQENCDAAHAAGRKFVGWPIDSEAEIRNAIEIGADAYFTNDTPLALELEKKYRRIHLRVKKGGLGSGKASTDRSKNMQADDAGTGKAALATILFASDYQAENGFDAPEETMRSVVKSVVSTGKSPDAAILCGDYTNDASLHDYQLSGEDAMDEIRELIKGEIPAITDKDMMFVQGNHDALTESVAESGLHEFDNYLVYVLNTEQDFPWKQGKTAGAHDKVKKAAAEMKSCFDSLIAAKETRPIIIAGHVPLHFTARTSSRHTTGDNLYSSLIFDVVNKAADSLDIIYLYGHNHSKGWDCYMGGAAVYKSPGETLLIPEYDISDLTSDKFEEKKLRFTYMNAGYVGYYMNCAPDEYSSDADSPYRAADETLTCTVCEVLPDRIEITRYDADGEHELGAKGEANPYKGGIDADLIAGKYYSSETDSPATIPRKNVSNEGSAGEAVKELDEAA